MKKLKQIFPALFISLLFVSCAGENGKVAVDSLNIIPEKNQQALLDSVKKSADSGVKQYVDSVNSILPKDSAKEKTNSSDKSQKEKQKILGSVWYSLPWCGGMMPPQETLDKLAKLKSFDSGTIILKDKSGNSFKIKTSPEGEFATEAPEGDYDVYLTEDAGGYWDVSADGCKNCLKDPITKTKLTLKGKNKIEFRFRCGPIPRP